MSVIPSLLRPQWLPDGKSVVVLWMSPDDSKETLNVAVVPLTSDGTFRTYHLPDFKDAYTGLLTGPCLNGDQLFLTYGSQRLARLNLKTGELKQQETPADSGDLSLYPAPAGPGPFYVQTRNNNSAVEFGRVDPQKLTLTPLMTITNQPAEGSFVAYDPTGTRLAVTEKDGEDYRVVVLEKGKTTFTRKLDAKGGSLVFASAAFSPKGDRLWASFKRKPNEGKTSDYGLMEIPLSQAPLRETILVPKAKSDDETAGFYFQAGISHDGKTAAVASTYLACTSDDFPAADCALFFVNLGDPQWKVTRVPIPMPANRRNPAK